MSNDDPLGRLASAVLKLYQCHQQVEIYTRSLAALEAGGLEEVTGERRLLEDMRQRLQEAMNVLATLPGDSPETERLLNRLEELVDDVTWSTATELQPELKSKLDRQDELVRQTSSDLRAWKNQIAELILIVQGAARINVPFASLELDLFKAESLVNGLSSALEDRSYRDLYRLHDSAKKELARLGENVPKIKTRAPQVAELVKEADLLIKRFPLSGGYYKYYVVLRCADRTLTRGINVIEGGIDLEATDRQWILETVSRLTDGINRRLRNEQAERRRPRSAPPFDAALPIADLTPTFQDLGKFMTRMVIPEQMHSFLRDSNWSVSITTNDPEIPWELMYLDATDSGEGDGSQFLCLRRSIARMPLGEIFPSLMPHRKRDVGRTRRMLLIHSDPDGTLPAARNEIARIAQELGPRLDIVRLDPDTATNAKLNQVLMGEPFDFIHYAGHAFFDTNDASQSGLVLKDNYVLTADKIRRINRGGSLIFLNACESGMVARENDLQQVSYLLSKPDPVVGLASAFMYTGALGCVGSLWPVYDDAAAELAIKFYSFVLDGDPTGEALRRARAEIQRDFPQGATWASYVLYGDPTFRPTEF